MKYSAIFKLTSLDVAPNGEVRPGALLRYFQETVNLQMHDNPPSSEDLLARGQAFVLSRMSMELYEKFEVYDEIKVVTWANTSKGATFLRTAQFYKGETLMANLLTVWALLDINAHRLLRVSDIEIGFPALDELPDMPLPERVRLPKTEMSVVGEKTVLYGDLDRNNHMNNTRYVDMVCDFLPDVENKHIKSFTVNFVSECKLGETLTVYHISEDGKDYFSAKKADYTRSLDVVMQLEEISAKM